MSHQTSEVERLPTKEWLTSLLIILALTVTVTFVREQMVEGHVDFAKQWDHHKYIWMANHDLGSFHISPFCWRIGLPALVSVTPVSTAVAFIVWTTVFVGSSAALIYVMFRWLGSDR